MIATLFGMCTVIWAFLALSQAFQGNFGLAFLDLCVAGVQALAAFQNLPWRK